MKKLMLVALILLVSITFGFLGFVYLSNPIVINGNNSTSDDGNGYHDIVFELYNEGISEVLIQEVLINNQAVTGMVDLGISYNTGQIVQSLTENERIKFHELDEGVAVEPRIPGDQVMDAINKKEMTPIHYGIRIKNYQDPIDSLTVKYKYLGLPISKEIIFNDED